MSDILRDRIAAVLIEAAEFRGVYQLHNPDMRFLADAVIEALEAGYVLVPKNVTLVRWADEAFRGQPEGKFKHERISHVCGVHCPYGPKDERCHHWTTADD